MNGPNRTQDLFARPSVSDYMNAIDRLRAREGMQQAMDTANATLRAVARLRAAFNAWTDRLAPRRILAKTGVTYFD